ncbi:hypothetical protein BDQ17DRAFT_1430509 [Cyathus striatus]|nr:hypothetical protein BDQ17DRAFT_1430509 [Cyathus striatus]
MEDDQSAEPSSNVQSHEQLAIGDPGLGTTTAETLSNVQSHEQLAISNPGPKTTNTIDNELKTRKRSKCLRSDIDLPDENVTDHSLKAGQSELSDLGEGGAYAGREAPVTSLQKFTGTIIRMLQGGFRSSIEHNSAEDSSFTFSVAKVNPPVENLVNNNVTSLFSLSSGIPDPTETDTGGSDKTIRQHQEDKGVVPLQRSKRVKLRASNLKENTSRRAQRNEVVKAKKRKGKTKDKAEEDEVNSADDGSSATDGVFQTNSALPTSALAKRLFQQKESVSESSEHPSSEYSKDPSSENASNTEGSGMDEDHVMTTAKPSREKVLGKSTRFIDWVLPPSKGIFVDSLPTSQPKDADTSPGESGPMEQIDGHSGDQPDLVPVEDDPMDYNALEYLDEPPAPKTRDQVGQVHLEINLPQPPRGVSGDPGTQPEPNGSETQGSASKDANELPTSTLKSVNLVRQHEQQRPIPSNFPRRDLNNPVPRNAETLGSGSKVANKVGNRFIPGAADCNRIVTGQLPTSAPKGVDPTRQHAKLNSRLPKRGPVNSADPLNQVNAPVPTDGASLPNPATPPNIPRSAGEGPDINNLFAAMGHHFNTFRQDQRSFIESSSRELKRQREKEYADLQKMILQEQQRTANIVSDTVLHERQLHNNRLEEALRKQAEHYENVLKSTIEQITSPAGMTGHSPELPCRAPYPPVSHTSSNHRRVIHKKGTVPFKDDPRRNFFLEAVRAHIKFLFGMTKDQKYDSGLIARFPPLSESELKKFTDHDFTFPEIMAQNFRIDFSRKLTIPFNVEASDVAVDDFIDNAKHGVYKYEGENFPDSFLERDVVLLAVQQHLQYISGQYAELRSEDPQTAAYEWMTKSARASHKNHLYNDRLNIVELDDEVMRHHDLIKAIGTAGISSDETDSGVEPKQFKTVVPSWRAKSLELLYHRLDNIIKTNSKQKIGNRQRAPGNVGRHRVHTNNKNPDTIAPQGLPINCYDPEWYGNLRLSQKRLLGAKLNVSYAFVETEGVHGS